MKVLVVSEEPSFIREVQERARSSGSVALGCLGPLNCERVLEANHRCSLLERSELVTVDAPRGVFSRGLASLPAGAYASRLRELNREAPVLLVTADRDAGPAGGVMQVDDRESALALLSQLLEAGEEHPRTLAKVP